MYTSESFTSKELGRRFYSALIRKGWTLTFKTEDQCTLDKGTEQMFFYIDEDPEADMYIVFC